MNAILVTLEALATPVIAIGGGITLTALTWRACQACRAFWRFLRQK